MNDVLESCGCASWEGAERHHVAVFSDEQFETLAREVLGDYHGATPHQGRLRCKRCGATFTYCSELTSTVVTREPEVDRVIAALREGKVAQVGGGRSFAWYEIRNGQPIMVTSDDGFTEDVPITEDHLREIVTTERALFLQYLRIWQR